MCAHQRHINSQWKMKILFAAMEGEISTVLMPVCSASIFNSMLLMTTETQNITNLLTAAMFHCAEVFSRQMFRTGS